MAIDSMGLVVTSSVVVSLALCTHTVLELRNFNAQSFSGALIAVGMLRELGGLTVSSVWCLRSAAYLAEETAFLLQSGRAELNGGFFLVRYAAALVAALPLSAYGMMAGIFAAALYAPMLGVGSTADFLESARQAVSYRDIVVYFFKLVLVNPTIALMASIAIGAVHAGRAEQAATRAVLATAAGIYIVNLLITLAVYLH